MSQRVIDREAPPKLAPIQVRNQYRIKDMEDTRKAMLATATIRALLEMTRPVGVLTPEQFGCAGDGVRDDSVELQRWADAGGPLHCWGRYFHTIEVGWHGNTHVQGYGIGTLYGPNTARPRHYNKSAVYHGEERVDQNMTFEGVIFEGDPNAPATAIEFIAFIGCQNLRFLGCTFKNSRMYLCNISNSRDVFADKCLFDNWGDNRKYATPGDAQWWGGVAFFMVTPCYNVHLTDCTSRNGHGIFLWDTALGEKTIVSGLVVDGAVEACLVGFSPGSQISFTSIENVTGADVSQGNICETWGGGWKIDLGYMRNCGSVFYVTDGHNISVTGGDMDLCSLENTWYSIGRMTVRNYDPSILVRDISISGTRIRATGSVGKQHAIAFDNMAGGKPFERIFVQAVDGGPKTQWKAPLAYYSPGNDGLTRSLVLAPSCYIGGNMGF